MLSRLCQTKNRCVLFILDTYFFNKKTMVVNGLMRDPFKYFSDKYLTSFTSYDNFNLLGKNPITMLGKLALIKGASIWTLGT